MFQPYREGGLPLYPDNMEARGKVNIVIFSGQTLHLTALNCTAHNCNALQCNALNCTTLHCTELN